MCYPYRHNSSKAKTVLYLIECGIFFGAENFIKTRNKKEATKLTRACFSPPKVLRQADQSEEDSFNLTGAGCFRAIQKLKKYEHGFLFSQATITIAVKELEEEAKENVDWHLIKIEDEGQRVEYKQFEKIIIESIKAHGLEERALTKGIKFALRSNGADFTQMCGHTSTGFCLLDILTKYPGTDLLIFNDGLDKKDRQKLKSYHTKDICHFLCMSQSKETTEHYTKTTRHLFTFMKKCATECIQTERGTYKLKC